MKRMLFVYNPKAGKGEIGLNLHEIINLFTQNGFLVTSYPTQAKENALQIVSLLGGAYDVVVCAGGDGTLNETVSGLMTLSRRPPLGYLPCGSTNDFATTLGLPKDLLLAARSVCQGRPYAVDIGKFGSQFFSYVAAFGLFTDVPYDTPQDLKNLLGHAAYMLEGVKRLASLRSHSCTVTIDGKKLEDKFVFGMVYNSTSIGGFKIPAEGDPVLDDGLFEVALLKKIRRFSQLQDVVGILMGNGKTSDALPTFRTSRVRVESEDGLKWTLDGEYGGTHTDILVENKKQAIEIIVPQDHLFFPE